MDDPERQDPVAEEISTDEVLSTSIERVRSSRQLIEQIEDRLARGQRLLDDDPSA
jgi:hypothetical protein